MRLIRFAAAFLLFGWVCLARAQSPTEGAAPAYVLPESETWELTSKEGDRYEIFVSIPSGMPPPADGYPVLYVLDGNAFFAGFAEARRMQGVMDPNIANALIVAVGYPTDKAYDFKRRMQDFTPPFPAQIPESEKVFASWKVGGQEQLASFLIDRLRPELGRRHPINLHRQALFGHSLGGLFALHMLFRHPDAFHAIIAASPSIYWADQEILTEEREFTERLRKSNSTQHMARILLVAGEREETRLELWDVEPLAQRLSLLSGYGLRSHVEIFKDETHLTVPTRAITPAMRFAFSWP
jgi:predicted alpha/beta superfamily hydrolase